MMGTDPFLWIGIPIPIPIIHSLSEPLPILACVHDPDPDRIADQ